MTRVIFLILSVVAVGVLFYFGIEKLQNKSPETDLFLVVPKDAISVIEFTEFEVTWNDVQSNNLIWDELQAFETFQEVQSTLNQMDSLIDSNEKQSILSNPSKITLSFVEISEESKKTVSWALQGKLKSVEETGDFREIISSILQIENTVETENFIELQGTQNTYYLSFNGDLFTLTPSMETIKNIQQQFINESNLLQDSLFVAIRATSSKNANVRFYIQPQKLIQAIGSSFRPKIRARLNDLPNLGSWCELDTELKPDEISMSGFIESNEKSDWLALFKNQESIKPRVTKYVPNRTAFMLHLGFSDFSKWRKNFVQKKFEKDSLEIDYAIKRWDTLYDVSIESDFLEWIDDELALVISEPDYPEIKDEAMLWVGSSDGENIFSKLTDLSLKVDNETQTPYYSLPYLGYTIHKLNIPDFISATLGNHFGLITENYFFQIDDYIVFANTPSVLQWTINRINSELTLEKDDHYQSFQNRITAESNVFLYSHIAGSPKIYEYLGSREVNLWIENQMEWLQKFQVASLQISYETEDLYFVNGYLRYNPVYKKETNSLWEIALENPVEMKPVMVTNHYSQAPEIFIQDQGNIIYLISNKGKILWKRQLDEPIQSEVQQIDVYKNGKLQLVFNTPNKIFIIDRNGRDLPNFPVQLSSTASNQLSILDYENSKDYRLLIGTQDGRIQNYGVNGLPVEGWSFLSKNNACSFPIRHLSIKRNDYLVCVMDNGSIKVLNRKGQERIKLKSKFNYPIKGALEIHEGSDLNSSYVMAVTTNKEVIKISLTDEKSRQFGIPDAKFTYAQMEDVDMDGSTEIVIYDSLKILAYKKDGNKVMEIPAFSTFDFLPNTYQFDDAKYFGYVSTAEDRIYLQKNNGELEKSFPLIGSCPFTISDINRDGRLNVISVNEKGLLFAFTLENK